MDQQNQVPLGVKTPAPSPSPIPPPMPSSSPVPVPVPSPIIPGLKSRKNFWIWSIFIIAVVAAGVAVYVSSLNTEDSWFYNFGTKQSKPSVSNVLPKGYQANVLPAGELPDKFPKELIFSSGKTQILRAEDTIVGTGQRYRIADIKSADKPEALVKLYEDSLKKLSWKLDYSITQKGIVALSFTKDAAELRVNFVAVDEGSQMNLTYITAK